MDEKYIYNLKLVIKLVRNFSGLYNKVLVDIVNR